VALGGERWRGEPAMRRGDLERRADFAERAERDAKVMLPVAAGATATLGEVERDAVDGIARLLGERRIVAADDRERLAQAADEIDREVVGDEAHGGGPFADPRARDRNNAARWERPRVFSSGGRARGMFLSR